MSEPPADLPLHALVRRIRARADTNSGRYLLGIAGPPGAGKSTLSRALCDALNADAGAAIAEVAPMDGFHLASAVLRAAGNLARKGEPETFDVAGFVAHLRRLLDAPAGAPVAWPTFDRTVDEPTPGGVVFAEQTIAITEGQYLLLDRTSEWSAVRRLLDECWYLDGRREVLAERLLLRHIRGGCTRDAALIKVRDSDLRNADLVDRTRTRADLVLREQDGRYYSTSD